MGNGIKGGQDIVALPARGAGDEQADQTPEEAQERTVDEVGRIDEEHGPLPALRLPETGPQFARQEVGLDFGVGFGRDGADLAPAQAESFFKKARTCVRPRRTPVCCAMAAWASRVERGGFAKK